MVRVTVELVPRGRGEPRHLGTAEIYNDGSGSRTRGNYKYRLFSKSKRVWKTGGIEGFPRTQRLGWDLLFRVLRSAVGDRNA